MEEEGCLMWIYERLQKNSKVKDYLYEKADQPAGIEDYGNNVKILCVCVHIM